jgi:ribonuclease P protein component
MASSRKRARITRSGDFDRVYRESRSRSNRFLVVHDFPRPGGEGGEDVRLGISVGRKVGNAVRRNAVKRALREAFWAHADGLPAAHDFVLVARADAAELLEREGAGAFAQNLGELLEETVPGSRERLT